MRTYEEYQEILSLWELGINKSKIALVTGIPRATVRDCINRYVSVSGLNEQWQNSLTGIPAVIWGRLCNIENVQVQQAYAYLLGLYLGDGDISKNRHIFRLRITLDRKYPNIIKSCVGAIQTILPDNQVGIVNRPGCVNVSCYHKFWPQIFPQDGVGRKHTRQIKLEPWQQQIVDCYPLEFFRGLFHSDGCRERNFVNGKDYRRYSFSDTSVDIRGLFCAICDRLGLHWTVASNGRCINIAKRKDVDYLDQVIGPKS